MEEQIGTNSTNADGMSRLRSGNRTNLHGPTSVHMKPDRTVSALEKGICFQQQMTNKGKTQTQKEGKHAQSRWCETILLVCTTSCSLVPTRAINPQMVRSMLMGAVESQRIFVMDTD